MRWRGVLSLLVLVLAWLALDDITTDNSTGRFVPEYSVLVASGVWFSGVAIWLLMRRRPILAIASLLAVALAVIAFWSLPHHYAPASLVNYSGLISIAWFLGLSVWSVARRERARNVHMAERQPV